MSHSIIVRNMQALDAEAFLNVHQSAARRTAAQDYPLSVRDAWAPPVTAETIARVAANPENEYRLLADIDGRLVSIGTVISIAHRFAHGLRYA